MTPSDITDITWAMMADAGIDTTLVRREPTWNGTGEYVLIKGDVKIAFGPAVDPVNSTTNGWDVSTYELVTDDGNDEPWWRHVRQEHAETPAEALSLVAAALPSETTREQK